MILHTTIALDQDIVPVVLSHPGVVAGSTTDTTTDISFDLSLYYYLQAIGLKMGTLTSDEVTHSVYVAYDTNAVSKEQVFSKLPTATVVEGNVLFIEASAAAIIELLQDDRYSVGGSSTHLKLMSETSESATVDLTNNWAKRRIYNRFRPFHSTVDIRQPLTPVMVHAYVMDSGINYHSELDVPVANLFSIVPGDYADKRGHGTAIASLIAGKTLGNIHKDVVLKSVKIFDTTSDVELAALVKAFIAIRDDVIAVRSLDPTAVAIVNMSWSIPKNPMIEMVILSMMFNYGIMFVCSAGNNGTVVDALTPASMKDIITVAASDENDAPCVFTNYNQPLSSGLQSNYGTNVDLFAPGSNIRVADASNEKQYQTVSGTSFSAAMTTGVLGLMAQCQMLQNQFEATEHLKATSTKNMLDMMESKYRSTPNNLLNVDLVTPRVQIDIVTDFITYDPAFYDAAFTSNPDSTWPIFRGTEGTTLELSVDPTKMDLSVDGNKIIIKRGSIISTEPYQILDVAEVYSGPNTRVTRQRRVLFLYDFATKSETTVITKSKMGTDVGISATSVTTLFQSQHPDAETVEMVKFKLDIDSVISAFPELETTIVGLSLDKGGCGTQTSCRVYNTSSTCDGNPGTNCYWDTMHQTCTQMGGACVAGDPCAFGVSCHGFTQEHVTRSGNTSICCYRAGSSTFENGYDWCQCA